MGGQRITCMGCGQTTYHYLSCGDRHCPLCQNIKKQLWIDKMAHILFPIPHFHIIFTLPHQLNELLFYNQKLLYGSFFESIKKALQYTAQLELGGKVGVVATLHTWGSNLSFHPHIHCIVSGGAFSPQKQWHYSKKKHFFANASLIQTTFKDFFLSKLLSHWENSDLWLGNNLNYLQHPTNFKAFFLHLKKIAWVVRIEKPMLGNTQIIEYLARYVRRVAITNSRILEIKNDKITFQYNNYTQQKEGEPPPKATLQIGAIDFIGRFLQHVLPTHFQRIRYFGLYAFGAKQSYQIAYQALQNTPPTPHKKRSTRQILMDTFGFNPDLCTNCGLLSSFIVERLPANPNFYFITRSRPPNVVVNSQQP